MDRIFREKINNYESETIIEQRVYTGKSFAAPVYYDADPSTLIRSEPSPELTLESADYAAAPPSFAFAPSAAPSSAGAGGEVGGAAALKYVVADYIIKDLS